MFSKLEFYKYLLGTQRVVAILYSLMNLFISVYDKNRLFGESCYRLMTKNGQFIYMRTRGCLDVDQSTRAVTSFVCTNTVVPEREGKQLIKMMKKKFNLMVNNNEESPQEEEIKGVSFLSLIIMLKTLS